MKISLASFLLISFIIWILPLGYFIKSSQEKMVCDGERAMCMCHAMVPKAMDKAMAHGIGIKEGSSSNKEGSSGGAGNYFVSVNSVVALNVTGSSILDDPFLAYKNPSLVPLEFVPKL